MQEQKKFRYIFNGEEVSKEEFEKLSEDSIKWFEGSSINSVPFSYFDGFFDGSFKSHGEINDHLERVLGGYNKPNTKVNSTRHKAREECKFHKYPLTPEECFVKDDVIPSTNRGEKYTIGYLNKVLDTHPHPFFSKRGKIFEYKKNEGVKETEGKLNYELDWQFIQQLAERMSQNKGKYEPYNWTKPMDVEKLKQSLFRHVIEVMKGNYSDDGREFGHWESIALNAMMINYQLKNNK